MKLKGCLTAVGLLVVILIGISFFMPKDMNMAVTKDLKASPEQIFAQVNDVKNWMNWSPWFKLDPDMEVTYGETTVGEGASYAWNSEKKSVGDGAMIINESIPNEKVGTTLKFEGGDDSYADINISPAEGGGSKVIWDFNSDYQGNMPWDRFKMGFYRMMLKGSYNKGLVAIDEYISANPEAHLASSEDAAGGAGIAIEEVEVPDFNTVTALRSGKISEMEENGHEIYAGAFGEVMEKVRAEGLTMSGHALAFGNEWDEEAGTFEIAIGVQVADGGETHTGGSAIKASYYGYYDGIGAAHEAVWEYMQSKGLKPAGAPWEAYVTDPEEEPDTAKWLTEVYYLIEPAEQ